MAPLFIPFPSPFPPSLALSSSVSFTQCLPPPHDKCHQGMNILLNSTRFLIRCHMPCSELHCLALGGSAGRASTRKDFEPPGSTPLRLFPQTDPSSSKLRTSQQHIWYALQHLCSTQTLDAVDQSIEDLNRGASVRLLLLQGRPTLFAFGPPDDRNWRTDFYTVVVLTFLTAESAVELSASGGV